jgi:hypothetical protein
MVPGTRFRSCERTGCGGTEVRFEVLEGGRAELGLRDRRMSIESVVARVRGRLELAEHGQVGWLRVESVAGRVGDDGEERTVSEFATPPTLEFVLVPPTPNDAAPGSPMAVTPSAVFNDTWELALWEHPLGRCYPDLDAIKDELDAARRGVDDEDDEAEERHEAAVGARLAELERLCDRVFEHLRPVRLARVGPTEELGELDPAD